MKKREDLLFKSSQEILDIQNQNFRRMVSLCASGHPYYRELFKELGLEVTDLQGIDDLVKLPLTHKGDYMENPSSFRLQIPDLPPAERLDWDVTYTTGTTTGMPTPFYNTAYDFFGILQQLRRIYEISGVTPDDVVVNLSPLSVVPHIAFFRPLWASIAVGFPIYFALTGAPHPECPVHHTMDEAVRLVEKKRATSLFAITSYLRRFLMRADELGVDFSSIRICSVSGEPCPPPMRADLKGRFSRVGAENVFINDRYGFTEMQGATTECVEFSGLHNPAPELYFFEIIDENTGKPLPEGEEGLLVMTHLNRRGTVLLRYVVGDRTTVSTQTCPHCGRNGGRFTISPYRKGDLVKIKGTLVNPAVILDSLTKVKALEEWQVVLTKEDENDPLSMDQLIVRVAVQDEQREKISREIEQVIKNAIEVRPKVQFARKEDIYDPQKSFKSKRFVDLRPRIPGF